ncbi:MAG: hypothetical protein IPP29_01815 [Bacteroidetes bacterium]|nr:hypothetical protein [Bacteroidota bacterium]
MQNCGNARVVGNTISNSNTLTGITNFRGIDAELCADGRFNCNTITNFTRGFNFTGNCNLTKLRKNNMSGYEHAVHLEANATLPSQGDLDIGTGKYIPYNNQWTYTGNELPNILKYLSQIQFLTGILFPAISTNPYYPLPATLMLPSHDLTRQ